MWADYDKHVGSEYWLAVSTDILGAVEMFALRVTAFPVPVRTVIPVAHSSSATRFSAVPAAANDSSSLPKNGVLVFFYINLFLTRGHRIVLYFRIFLTLRHHSRLLNIVPISSVPSIPTFRSCFRAKKTNNVF